MTSVAFPSAGTRCCSSSPGTFAVLTSKGRTAFRRAAPIHLRGIQQHFAGHLDGDEAEVLHAVLARVAGAARHQGRPQGP